MHYLYILKSLKDKKLYIGQSSDLRRRLLEHNKGSVPATKYRAPLKLAYYEAYANKSDAVERERNLKLFKNAYTGLMRRIKISLEDSS